MVSSKRMAGTLMVVSIAIVYFLFVIHQFFQLNQLNVIAFGGDFHNDSIPFYFILLIFFPFIAFLSVYIPGLVILSIQFHLPCEFWWNWSQRFNPQSINLNYQVPYVNDLKRIQVLRC